MQYIVLFTAYSWLIDCASSTMLTFCVCWAKFVHCALDWTSFICENNRMVTWNYTIAQDSRCQVTISLWTWGIILPSPKFPKSWRNFFHYSLFLHIWSSSVSHCGMIPFKQIMKTCEINYRPWRIMWTFNSSLAGGGSCSNGVITDKKYNICLPTEGKHEFTAKSPLFCWYIKSINI